MKLPIKKNDLAQSDELTQFSTQLGRFNGHRRGHRFELVVKAAERLKEIEHGSYASPRVLIGCARFGRRRRAFAEHFEGRIPFALFAFFEHDPQHFPNVAHRFKVIAPVAHDVDDLNDSPILQFAQAVADVRARDPERFGNVFCRQGLLGEIQERMDLGHGSIDPPFRPHFPPVEDELLVDGIEGGHFLNFR